MTSKEKAKKYIEEGKVFPIMKNEKFDYWAVEGGTGTWEIRYDKQKKDYRCNCKNVRLTPCCHILSIKLYKDGKNDKSI